MGNRISRRAFLAQTALSAGMTVFASQYSGLAAHVYGEEDVPIEIERMKKKYGIAHSIAELTPTVCAASGVRAPKTCQVDKIEQIVNPLNEAFEGKPAQKFFIYCGDCFGDVLLQKHPEEFEKCIAESDAVVKSVNVMKTVTPVCFATIFCGAGPEVHGIKVYEKPQVQAETLFDVFLEAGKKVAILSAKGNSVITIFRGREIDYYPFSTDKEAYEKSLEVLNDYDLVVVHDCEHDTEMHKHGLDSPEAAAARRAVLDRWQATMAATDDAWSGYNRLYVFATDHGSHNIDGGAKGSHGDDIADDAIVNHFYRWRKADAAK